MCRRFRVKLELLEAELLTDALGLDAELSAKGTGSSVSDEDKTDEVVRQVRPRALLTHTHTHTDTPCAPSRICIYSLPGLRSSAL